MGGYAAYIWPSYGFAALVLIALLISAWHTMRVREAEVERLRGLGADPRRRDRSDKDVE
jgi:heme exporter protein D